MLSLALAVSSFIAGVDSRTVPANLKTFYNQVKVCTLFSQFTYPNANTTSSPY